MYTPKPLKHFFKLLLFFLLFISTAVSVHAQTAVSTYGQLKVSGNRIVDQNNNPVQLQGMSLFWSQWEGSYYNATVVQKLKNDWCTNIVRAAMAVEQGGYLTNANSEKQKVKTVVDAAIANGMYVIIDWHDHNAHNHQNQAIEFFTEMAQTYGDYPNIIYEVFNEPLNVSWSNTIKPYCNAVIAAIRQHDPDNIIVCGTPNWSQDVDDAANDPITSSTNIAYTLHFYAGTHGASLRNKANTALSKGLALFVTEFGLVNADGNGGVNTSESNNWFNWMDQNKISHCNWSLCDKDEGSAALQPGTGPTSDWNNRLTASGTFMKNRFAANCPVYEQPKDCNGVAGGSASIDDCGTCSGGNTGITPNSTCQQDCNGVWDGTASVDDCGECSGGNTGITPNSSCERDCNGVLNGSASIDNCGVCSGGNTGINPNSTCEQDCNGDYNGTAFTDECGRCVGGETGLPSCNQEAFNGSGHLIPGRIQGEEYDHGGEDVAFYDIDPENQGGQFRTEAVDIEQAESSSDNFNIAYTEPGEWLEYTVTVQSGGTFKANFRIASQDGDGSWHLDLDGSTILESMDADNTGGWQDYTIQESPEFDLEAGNYHLRFIVDEGGFNLDYIEFEQLTVTSNVNSISKSQISIYPNPTKDKVTINNLGTNNWTMYNSLGEVVKKGNQSEIDMTVLPSGVYFLSIDGNTEQIVKY